MLFSMWRGNNMVVKVYRNWEIIDMVNKDMGEDLFMYLVPDDDIGGYALLVAGYEEKTKNIYLGNKYVTYTDKEEIERQKKKILSAISGPWGASSFGERISYEEALRISKSNLKKKRNYHKAIEYLKDRYKMDFGGYANMGDELRCYVIYPNANCRETPIFKFSMYYNLWFDKDGNINQKSLDSFCRKMDKVVVRMRCLFAAFGDEDFRITFCRFYQKCSINKSSDGDWIIKFPYCPKRVIGENKGLLLALMDMFRYKDTDYCIWKASTPEEFETTLELIRCQ